MDRMKPFPRGQFTWSVVFFILELFSSHVFVFLFAFIVFLPGLIFVVLVGVVGINTWVQPNHMSKMMHNGKSKL